MQLEVLAGELAVCRLGPDEDVPPWATEQQGLQAVVRTPEELSIVCNEGSVPDGIEAAGGWRALRVAGTLDLSLTGVLIELLTPLERAAIAIFAISTFDTDYVLVPGDRLAESRDVLRASGHRFVDPTI